MSDRIILADDHPLFRAALVQAVHRVLPGADIVEAGSLAEARGALGDGASLICLDLHMCDSTGFIGLTELRQDFPAIPVVVISASEAPGIGARALEFGASGFIPKTAGLDTLVEALRAVLAGDIWALDDADELSGEAADATARLASLTPAQMRVLQGVAAGKLNKQIAFEMAITEATVKAHITAIFRKLGVINRPQATLVARALDVEPPAA